MLFLDAWLTALVRSLPEPDPQFEMVGMVIVGIDDMDGDDGD